MKPMVLVLVVMVAVLLPTAASSAQSGAGLDCVGGEFIEGRCVSVDDQDSLCAGTACVEFVEESTLVCPADAVEVGASPLACQQAEPALDWGPSCPEGSRGEPGLCFFYVAIGPDGCPTSTFTEITIDATGNCRVAVDDLASFQYCDRSGADLVESTCTYEVDPIISPCPQQTTRFDGACWQLNGLTSPESCAGHNVAGTVELASGLCEVPLSIPTGPSTCVDSATYGVQYQSVLYTSGGNNLQGFGSLVAGCIDDSQPVGSSIAHCFFPDDDLPWGDFGGGGCTRFEEPVSVACPSGYSFDDALGGVCTRTEPATNDTCPRHYRDSSSCYFTAEFSTFECSAGMERDPDWPQCVAFREMQYLLSCQESALLAPDTEGILRCFARVGPQPDACNGIGTVADCYQILEPLAAPCATASGCVSLAETCDATGPLNGGCVFTCSGLEATLVGTNGNDDLRGTSGRDVIVGLGGNDTIRGLSGSDVICGGPGNDKIYGSLGLDVLYGDGGKDTIFGGPGDDEIFGGNGADILYGVGGDDAIDGGLANDLIYGLSGDDTMVGGPGNDEIYGVAGNDRLSGNAGSDVLGGGVGNDVLRGGNGNDNLKGGSGRDNLKGNNGTDVCNSGLGADIVDNVTCETIS